MKNKKIRTEESLEKFRTDLAEYNFILEQQLKKIKPIKSVKKNTEVIVMIDKTVASKYWEYKRDKINKVLTRDLKCIIQEVEAGVYKITLGIDSIMLDYFLINILEDKLIMYDYNKTGGVITIDNLQDKRYIDVLNELGEKNNGDYWW